MISYVIETGCLQYVRPHFPQFFLDYAIKGHNEVDIKNSIMFWFLRIVVLIILHNFLLGYNKNLDFLVHTLENGPNLSFLSRTLLTCVTRSSWFTRVDIIQTLQFHNYDIMREKSTYIISNNLGIWKIKNREFMI